MYPVTMMSPRDNLAKRTRRPYLLDEYYQNEMIASAILSSHRNLSAEVKKEMQLEIAYVLFIDMVGSKLSINEQNAVVDELTKVVRAMEQFQKPRTSRKRSRAFGNGRGGANERSSCRALLGSRHGRTLLYLPAPAGAAPPLTHHQRDRMALCGNALAHPHHVRLHHPRQLRTNPL